jgi:YggT family protein
MFYLIKGITGFLDVVLQVYMWIVIAAALISWVNPGPYNPIVRFLYRVTEPVLRPIRNLIGIRSGLDFSPLIVILIIYVLRQLLTLLEGYAWRLR